MREIDASQDHLQTGGDSYTETKAQFQPRSKCRLLCTLAGEPTDSVEPASGPFAHGAIPANARGRLRATSSGGEPGSPAASAH